MLSPQVLVLIQNISEEGLIFLKSKNPTLLIVKRDRSGDDQYLEHLIVFLEVLAAISENANENRNDLESTKC